MIELHNVTKKFGANTQALLDINLKISQGDFVFIVGPTGSGKTTLLRLLTREIIPSVGKVTIEGEDLAKLQGYKVTQLRRQIGVIFQDFKLLIDQTVFENVALPLEILGLKNKEIVQRVNNILELVGLSNQRNLFPAQLSGGEVQRTTIARAIINDPKVILGDEPTGNLDPATSWEIIKLLKDIHKKRGVPLIIATHNMDIVNTLGKRVVRIEGGKIISDKEVGKYEKS
ncbi:cell division ATP-binding protein FtsE [Candidatus Microgenomates bacterium]|nr:cell division ATP-binding protein FtsE [Candidatus Microgenomates bacterium]